MPYQGPVLRQEQKLKITPQMIQSMNLMALPIMDLRTKIQEELEANPALEVVEDKSTVSLEDIKNKPQQDEYNIFDETSDSGYISNQNYDGEDLKRKFLEGAISKPITLQDHLLWQLRLQLITEEEFKIGEMLISNLDHNGFHIQPPENLIEPEKIPLQKKVIEIIQDFDPLGVCSSGFQEALLIQIRKHPDPEPHSDTVVEHYLALLGKGRFKEIAAKLKISEQDVKDIAEFIGELEPIPGRNFEGEPSKYVVPDVMVKMKDGEFVLLINDEEIPVLGVSSFFTDIIDNKDQKKEKEVNTFVNNSLRDARWFIQSISRRNQTLLKVCKAIIDFQRDFFRKGVKHLNPLTLKQIADEIGVDPSTISRVTNGKYIQTEYGIFELKFFFSSSLSSTKQDSSTFAKEAVKEIIREIIEKEGNGGHLSDSKIQRILTTRGIKIARRTVTKYRNELDILSSFNR